MSKTSLEIVADYIARDSFEVIAAARYVLQWEGKKGTPSQIEKYRAQVDATGIVRTALARGWNPAN